MSQNVKDTILGILCYILELASFAGIAGILIGFMQTPFVQEMEWYWKTGIAFLAIGIILKSMTISWYGWILRVFGGKK